MKTHCVQLSNGLKMPLLGIGCRAGQDQQDVATAVEAALLGGYRHIDTAFSHGNEQEVGTGINAVLHSGKLSRSDIFVVTKLPMMGMQPGKAEAYLRRSLQLLNLEYVDLYLVHHPVGLVEQTDQESAHNGNSAGMSRRDSMESHRNSAVRTRRASLQNGIGGMPNGNGNADILQGRRRTLQRTGSVPNGDCSISNWSRCVTMDSGSLKLDLATDLLAVWRDMEHLVKLGLANSIGVSNFNAKQLTKIVAAAEIPPTVLQIECHVYFQQREMRDLCEKHNIAMTAFGSLGSPGRKLFYESRGVSLELPDLLHNPVVRLVALRYKRTPAQVLLRFMSQQNVAVIPKSTDVKRIQENGSIFNFRLDEVDMAALQSLDRGEAGRYFHFKDVFPGYDKHPEYPF